jgi:hypothetical protein
MSEEPNPEEKKFWFPAKKYGWGWGPPVCWQGWIIMLGYFGMVGAGAFLLLPKIHTTLFFCYVGALTIALIVICFLKGEKPGWRWGGK